MTIAKANRHMNLAGPNGSDTVTLGSILLPLLHRRRARSLSLLVGLVWSRPVMAQAVPQAPTLDEVVTLALRANPDIVQARLRVDSATGEQRIARALPNPSFSSAPNQPWQYTVTLPLDVTPQRFLRTRAAAPDLAHRRFLVTEPDRVRVGDVTMNTACRARSSWRPRDSRSSG